MNLNQAINAANNQAGQVIHLHAAIERKRHRDLLQTESERLERMVRYHEAEARRLSEIRAQVLAKLAGATP